MNVIEFLQKLLRCKSITPVDDGAIDALAQALQGAGFVCHILEFDGDGSYPVKNLYARYGTTSPNFCFAGHTDVVPIGELAAWQFDPFVGSIKDGIIYGRGVVDMKGAIAAKVVAATDFVKAYSFEGSISFLITGDEEADAINGTPKVLKHLEAIGEKLDVCIIGEPTSPDSLGEIIKIGSRGSANFTLSITGIQGHVAYQQHADNPITRLVRILSELKKHKLDEGSENFEPSNLEITSINVNNTATNLIPGAAYAMFNIRFNDLHTSTTLTAWAREICERHAPGQFQLIPNISGESFVTDSSALINMSATAIADVLNIKPEFNTSGATSDARFIQKYCPVIECGLSNKTAHQVDEHAAVQDIESLVRIYYRLLEIYFKPQVLL